MNMLLPKTASSVSETELAVYRQAFEFLVERIKQVKKCWLTVNHTAWFC